MVYLPSEMNDNCVFSLISPLIFLIFTDLENVLDSDFRHPKILELQARSNEKELFLVKCTVFRSALKNKYANADRPVSIGKCCPLKQV